MSLNQELAELFKTAAAVMEIKGEAVFKAIAFQRVSRALEDSTIDLKKAVEDGTIDDLEGVGKSSRKIIVEYVTTGRSTDLDELQASIPAGLIPMMQIPSLGPKTIKLLWQERGITSVDELAAAIKSGKLDGLKGIGPKKIQSIQEGIAIRTLAGERKGLLDVLPIAQAVLDRVRQLDGVVQAEVAGSLRRWKETIGDVDILATIKKTVKDPGNITLAFTKFPEVNKTLVQGDSKASILTAAGLQIDLRIVPEENFGAALQYFTGSKDHNKKLRGMALDQGMTLNEWGLYKLADYEKAEKEPARAPKLKPVASKTEADIYNALGLDYIEPELREDRGELEQARDRTLPKLITVDDIRADLHTHTTASDGINSILEMAEAAKAKGYRFLAITDHSKSQVVANGLDAKRLLKHVAAIHKAGEQIKGIKLLAGCEVDILADGSLDFGEDVLAELDWVVASPHVSLKQETQKATDRILRAIDTKYVNLIGHPTGRIINQRNGLPLEISSIVERAAKANVGLEINAGWPRLDLRDTHAHAALAAGVTLSINTDAHSIEGLDGMHLGVAVARRAGATISDVLNTWKGEKLLDFIAAKR